MLYYSWTIERYFERLKMDVSSMNENESIEFNENYTEKIYKEIIAFLNTNSGTIYIGYDDNGNLKGVNFCQ